MEVNAGKCATARKCRPGNRLDGRNADAGQLRAGQERAYANALHGRQADTRQRSWILSCRARSVLLRTAAAFRRMMPIMFIWQKKRQAYFESELRQRYGISTADLNERYGSSVNYESVEEDASLPFPTLHVRSWDALRKHAAEMLIYADPVRYEEKIRSIRVSNRPREAKAYLSNMYRHEGNNHVRKTRINHRSSPRNVSKHIYGQKRCIIAQSARIINPSNT